MVHQVFDHDDLHLGQVFGNFFRRFHHQNGTNGKVWTNEDADTIFFSKPLDFLKIFRRKSRRADNRIDTMASNDPQAVHDNIGTRNVNHNIRFTSYEGFLQTRVHGNAFYGLTSTMDIDSGNQFHVLLLKNRSNDSGTHLAKGSIDQYFNHWLHPFSIYKNTVIENAPNNRNNKAHISRPCLFITDSAPPNNGDSIPAVSRHPSSPLYPADHFGGWPFLSFNGVPLKSTYRSRASINC